MGYNPCMAGGESFISPTGEVFKGVPLFPLPNVVLFPKAILPLHIFEERYKTMIVAALKGPRRVAMALLQHGWEKNYYAHPVIDPIVCIGQILSHEQLPDGKYNFLLQGVSRAKLIREHDTHPYRTADLQQLIETPVLDLELSDQRKRMTEALHEDFAAMLPGAEQFTRMLAGPFPTAAIADLIAYHLFDDVPFKQALLADCDVRRRVTRVAEALHLLHPPLGKTIYPKDPSCN